MPAVPLSGAAEGGGQCCRWHGAGVATQRCAVVRCCCAGAQGRAPRAQRRLAGVPQRAAGRQPPRGGVLGLHAARARGPGPTTARRQHHHDGCGAHASLSARLPHVAHAPSTPGASPRALIPLLKLVASASADTPSPPRATRPHSAASPPPPPAASPRVCCLQPHAPLRLLREPGCRRKRRPRAVLCVLRVLRSQRPSRAPSSLWRCRPASRCPASVCTAPWRPTSSWRPAPARTGRCGCTRAAPARFRCVC